MHREEPNVVHLPVHLEGEHMVFYDPNDGVNNVLECGAAKVTTLTAWFKANQTMELARQYTYQEFPQHFVWRTQQKDWKPRQRGFAIGQMYFVTPSAGERFYLRTLLTVTKGAKFFEDLRTVDGHIHPTFQAACLALGLLENDNEWVECLEEAGAMKTGTQLRSLFALILLHCNPAQPLTLWDQFKDKICDDLAHKLCLKGIPQPTDDQVCDYGLFLLEHILMESGHNLSQFPPMPSVQGDWAAMHDNMLLAEQLDYNPVELQEIVNTNLELFNPDQMAVFDSVIQSSGHSQGKTFFVHSAGGYGKTFLCNTIAAQVRAQGHVALTVASSGIASLLLKGGRTAHSRFKIPIPIMENSKCNIGKNSDLAKVLQRTRLIYGTHSEPADGLQGTC